jgi:hypothetical protein
MGQGFKALMLRSVQLAGVLLSGPMLAQGAIVGIGPFVGDISESWESFPNYGASGYPPATYLSNPTSIMAGRATIHSPYMLVYDANPPYDFGLGEYSAAGVSDGVRGMGLNRADAVTTINFASGVSSFGAYWAGIYTVSGLRPDITINFYDQSSELIGSVSFVNTLANGDLQWFGWKSDIPIYSVQYSGDYSVIDGLQAKTLAGRTWLSVGATWNVSMEEMLAACDRVTGKCTGSVTVQGSQLDLSGYVWASRMEAIDYVVAMTGIPVDLTGTVYDGDLWRLECNNNEYEQDCPPEHGIWFDFVGQNLTREGGSSFSFQGVTRDSDYYPSPGESYVSTLWGHNRGEGTSIFADSTVWIEKGLTCDFGSDECWDAYGYFLYKPTPQPVGLASISLSKTTIAGCKSLTGKLTLTAPAPAGGLTVKLSDTLSAATLPVSVTIPAGSTSKSFTVKTIPVSAAQIGTVNATLDGRTLSKGLTVRPIGVSSVSLYPTKVVGGSKVAGTVKLECNAPAPAGITVDLASTFAAVANPVAASITVPAGYKSWLFDVATYPVLSKTSAKISGTANGITKSGSLTVTPAASVSATKLAFGNQVVGTTSGPRFVTLSNKGTLPFSVDSIVITGTYARGSPSRTTVREASRLAPPAR